MRIKEIETRKSVRKYKETEITRAQIDEILEAGRLAPSAKNKQPWHFLVYRNAPKKELLDCMERGLEKQKKNPFMPKQFKRGLISAANTLRIMRQAPVIILVLNEYAGSPFRNVSFGSHVQEILDSEAIGACIENMVLTAANMGIGTLWIGNTVYAHKELADFVGTDKQIAAAVAVGYADETPHGRSRKSLEELTEYFE